MSSGILGRSLARSTRAVPTFLHSFQLFFSPPLDLQHFSGKLFVRPKRQTSKREVEVAQGTRDRDSRK